MIPRLEIHFDRKERKLFRKGLKEANCENGEFLLNHARSGLLMTLQALQLDPQTGVGMMVYNCHTVMNSIMEAGCKPVFVDVTDCLTIDMEDLERKHSLIKVLIVTHLFGIINDVKTIKVKYPELIIIEDCAHCFEHELEGDFGVYSIGQGKFPSIGDGGVLILNHKSAIINLKSSVDKIYSSLSEYSKLGEMLLFLRLWVKAMMYKPLIYENITMRMKNKRDLGRENIRESVVVRKMSRGIANILVQKRTHYSEAVAERLANAKEFVNHNSLIHNNQWFIGSNAFMIVMRTKDVVGLKKQFADIGIEIETHFAHCIDWAQQFGYQLGSCPNAERLTHVLVMIPTYRRF